MFESNRVPRSVVWTPVKWLVTGEALIFALAVPFAMALHNNLQEGQASASLTWITLSVPYVLFMLAVMHALGMHVIRSRHSAINMLLKYVCAGIAGYAGLFISVYAMPELLPETFLLFVATATSFTAIVIWHALVGIMIDAAVMQRKVLVIGAGRHADAFNEALRRRCDRRGLNIIGFIPTDGAAARIDPSQLLHVRTPVYRVCERNNIDEVIIATDSQDPALPIEELLECRFRGVRVSQAASFIERECGRIPVELVEPHWWLYRKGFAEGAFNRFMKRVFDVVAGSVILALAAPVMLLAAIAIKLEDGFSASVFYRQKRVGRGGKPFELIKFRSMHENAEKDGVARWAKADDDRITRVGRILRKTRIDELPQLFNVMKGDMSLVGPRPERPEFVRQLAAEIPYYERRHVVRPGITGWAQLSYPYGASTRDALEKLKYDLYYIKNFSLWFDVAIVLRTVEVVLFGKGAR